MVVMTRRLQVLNTVFNLPYCTERPASGDGDAVPEEAEQEKRLSKTAEHSSSIAAGGSFGSSPRRPADSWASRGTVAT